MQTRRQTKAANHLFAIATGAIRSWQVVLSISCVTQLFLASQWAHAQSAANIQTPVSSLSNSHIKSVAPAGLPTPTSGAPAQHAQSSAAQGNSPYVNGVLFGKKFTLSKVSYNSRYLYLKSAAVPVLGDIGHTQANPGIRIKFATDQRLEGKSFKLATGQDRIAVGEELQPKPLLELDYIAGGSDLSYLDTIIDHSPYTMTLNFYKQQNGLLPGFIDLEIFCPQKTKIKGYFWAAPG
jgi:hypothetical protein